MQHFPHWLPAERLRLLLRLAVVCLAAQPLVSLGADTLDLAQLMQNLARVKAGEATFTEVRHVAMLDQTLHSSGKLSFAAPDTFVRETLKPRRERVAITGNTMTLSQGERSRSMALDSAPEAAVIVEAIRGTLTGNRETLDRNFSVSVSGDHQKWMLDLVPRSARLRMQVDSVRIGGQQGVVREVLVTLPDGDRSVMHIDPMVPTAAAPAGAPGSAPSSAPTTSPTSAPASAAR